FGFHDPALILALVLVGGVVFGLSVPAWNAMVPQLVPASDLPSAVRLSILQFQGTRALGPALAGLALSWGPTWAFGFNALSYLAVVAAITAIPARQSLGVARTGSLVSGFREGVAYAWRVRSMR